MAGLSLTANKKDMKMQRLMDVLLFFLKKTFSESVLHLEKEKLSY